MQQETQQDYRSILELGPFPPSIRNLQSCLETAWSDGTYLRIIGIHQEAYNFEKVSIQKQRQISGDCMKHENG